jgi:hypothetical protein
MLDLKPVLTAAGAVCFVLGVSGSAQAAQFFDFSYSGLDVEASGRFTTTDLVNGFYTITGISGQRNGVSIGSLATLSIPPVSNTLQVRNERVVSPNYAVTYETIISPNFAYRLGDGSNSIFYINHFYRNSLPPRASYSYYLEDVGRPPTSVSFSLRPVSTIPTPALLPGLIGLGFGALRKKVGVSEQV